MGMIEVEIVKVYKQVVGERDKLDALVSKLALIIERQAMGLKGIEWQQESLERAKTLDKELFHDLQRMNTDLNPHAENPNPTSTP